METTEPIYDRFVTYILRGFPYFSTSSWSVGKSSNGHQNHTRVKLVIAPMIALTTVEETTTLNSSSRSAVNDLKLKLLALNLQKRLHLRLVQTEHLYQLIEK